MSASKKAPERIPEHSENGVNMTYRTRSNNAICPFVIVVIDNDLRGSEEASVTAKPYTGNERLEYKRLANEDRGFVMKILETTIQFLKHYTDETNETHDITNLLAQSRSGADTKSRSRSQKQVLKLILQIGQSSLHLSLEYTSGRLTDASVTGKRDAGDTGRLIMNYRRSTKGCMVYLTNILEITILVAKHNADMACQQKLFKRTRATVA